MADNPIIEQSEHKEFHDKYGHKSWKGSVTSK